MSVCLLIVDPEQDFAEVLRDHLTLAWSGWTLRHASTAEAAEAALTCERFDAVVVNAAIGCDAVVGLLADTRAIQPDCVRLVMANPETLEGPAELVSTCHRVLVEPCEPFALCIAVEHARRLRDVLGRSGVRALGLRRTNRGSRRPTGDLLSTG